MPASTGSAAEQTARLLLVLDLVGVFVFALEGALAAMVTQHGNLPRVSEHARGHGEPMTITKEAVCP